ncbi:MAG: hypothetical protein R3C97_03940 [Geminicoccaceae bacterium]
MPLSVSFLGSIGVSAPRRAHAKPMARASALDKPASIAVRRSIYKWKW